MSQDDATAHHNHQSEEQTGLLLGRGLSINRIEALADGVFAVAMTLLVFNVQFPDVKMWRGASSIWDVVRDIFVHFPLFSFFFGDCAKTSFIFPFFTAFFLLYYHQREQEASQLSTNLLAGR